MPDEKFDSWGIAEVLGHKRFAGRITEQSIAGAAFVRVDVPEVEVRDYHVQPEGMRTVAPYTKYIGAGSIYMITPTTEEVARKAAISIAQWDGDPIPVRMPEERQIPATTGPHDEDDFEAETDALWDAAAEDAETEAAVNAMMAEGDKAQSAEQTASELPR